MRHHSLFPLHFPENFMQSDMDLAKNDVPMVDRDFDPFESDIVTIDELGEDGEEAVL